MKKILIISTLVLSSGLMVCAHASPSTVAPTPKTATSTTHIESMERELESLKYAFAKLTPEQRTELTKIVRDYITSKGITIPVTNEIRKEVKKEIKEIKKETKEAREDHKERIRANQEKMKKMREEMRERAKKTQNGTGTTLSGTTRSR